MVKKVLLKCEVNFAFVWACCKFWKMYSLRRKRRIATSERNPSCLITQVIPDICFKFKCFYCFQETVKCGLTCNWHPCVCESFWKGFCIKFKLNNCTCVAKKRLLKALEQSFMQPKHSVFSFNTMTETSPKAFSHRGASCKLNCILLWNYKS